MKNLLPCFFLLFLVTFHTNAQQQGSTTEPKLIGSESFQSQPEYPGGMAAFNAYITSSIKDNELYKEKMMIITLTIKSDGTAEKMSILKSINRRVDKQVMKAIKHCKKWKPAYKDNVPVEVQLHFPIRFN